MAKKNKENMKEQYVFNDYASAESIRNKTKEINDKINKLLLLSVALTALIWVVLLGSGPLTEALRNLPLGESAMNNLSGEISYFVDFASIFLAGCSLVIYALAGALPEALKIVNACAKACWYLTPFVFIDLIMYLVGAVLGLAVVLLMPCLTMLLCRIRVMKENAAAEEYMRRIEAVNAGHENDASESVA